MEDRSLQMGHSIICRLSTKLPSPVSLVACGFQEDTPAATVVTGEDTEVTQEDMEATREVSVFVNVCACTDLVTMIRCRNNE